MEVVKREKETGNVIVVAGYGEQTQWYKDLKHQPQTTIPLESHKHTVSIDLITPEAGEGIITRITSIANSHY